MTRLEELLKRAKDWPEPAQEQLVELGLEIEDQMKGGYHVSAEEAVGIERGLQAAREGRFATKEEVEAVLAKFRVA
jgi:predicted transcriptional regulator